MGICLPKELKDTIDKARGDIPRSTYISKLLKQIHKKKEENQTDKIEENQQRASGNQPRQLSANLSSFPFIDSRGRCL